MQLQFDNDATANGVTIIIVTIIIIILFYYFFRPQ